MHRLLIVATVECIVAWIVACMVACMVACGAPAPTRTSLPSNTLPAPATHPLALPIVNVTCAQNLPDACELPALAESKAIGDQRLSGCTIASRLELRSRRTLNGRVCELLVQHGSSIAIVDTGIYCMTTNSPATLATMGSGECRTDTSLAVELAVAKRRIGITCERAGDAMTCTRPAPAAPSPELAELVTSVETAVESHDWRALLAMCSPSHKKSQLGELGQSQPAYIAEILELHSFDNSLSDGEITTAHLDAIATIEIADYVVDPETGVVHVLGWATLATGKRMRVALMIVKQDGRYMLTGAVG